MIKVLHTENNIIDLVTNGIYRSFNEMNKQQDEIVVICVGTDRSTGDCLGPLVGTYLKEHDCPVTVYGSLNEPVHAMNLEETLQTVKDTHDNPFVIAIDACLGQLTNVGYIQIGAGPVMPGAGVGKKLPAVGNINITGIVNVGGFMEYFVLQNTRLSLVMNMAEVIAKSLNTVLSTPIESIKEVAAAMPALDKPKKKKRKSRAEKVIKDIVVESSKEEKTLEGFSVSEIDDELGF